LRADFYALLRQADHRAADNYGTVRQRAPVAEHPESRGKSRFAHYVTGLDEKIVTIVFAAALTALIVFGWMNRHEHFVAPNIGLGYWLGIAGTVSLLLLLAYPLRKRLTGLRLPGHVSLWFRAHMALGLVGPTLILFHANFQFGAFNSSLALLALLIVAASGRLGRYLHGKSHLGHYGRRATVREILADADSLRNLLGDRLPLSDFVVMELNTFVRLAIIPRPGLMADLCRLPVLNLRTFTVRRRLCAEARWLIKGEAQQRGWSWSMRRERLAGVVELMTMHLAAVKKAAEFDLYARLFGIWLAVHVPLFILLALAAGAHIVVAHLY